MRYFSAGLAFFFLASMCAHAVVVENNNGVVKVNKWGGKKAKHESERGYDYKRLQWHEIGPTWMHVK
jgi:hypothetical protein